MQLQSKRLKVSEIIHRTQSAFFKKLRVGSCIQISIDISLPSRLPVVNIVNLDNLETTSRGYTVFRNMLSNFKFIEIPDIQDILFDTM